MAIGIEAREPGGGSAGSEVLAGTRRIPRENTIKALGFVFGLSVADGSDWRFGWVEVSGKWVLLIFYSLLLLLLLLLVFAALSTPPSRHF